MSNQIVVRKDPFDLALNLHNAMDRFFNYGLMSPDFAWRGFGDQTLALDMVENNDALVLRIVLPGVKPDDINISVTGDTLTIQGEIRDEHESNEDSVHVRERQYGRFSRTVTLPTGVVADKADAQFEQGILTLTLPKAEDAKPKVIAVKARK